METIQKKSVGKNRKLEDIKKKIYMQENSKKSISVGIQSLEKTQKNVLFFPSFESYIMI